MGKSVGLIGELQGKVGNVVFYRRNGVQVARVYVAHPSNPKSAAQNRQRLKMALAGRLSSIVPYAAIEGFGGSRSQRRSMFLKGVMVNAVSGGGRASIDEGSILFSDGAVGVMTAHSVTGNYQSETLRTVSIVTSTYGEVLPEGYGERFVVLMLNTGTSQFDFAVTGLLEMPTGGGSQGAATTTVSVRVGSGASGDTYRAVVYTYPFVVDREAAGRSFRASFIGTEDGTVVVDLLSGEVVSVPLLFGRSIKLNAVDIVPPQQ